VEAKITEKGPKASGVLVGEAIYADNLKNRLLRRVGKVAHRQVSGNIVVDIGETMMALWHKGDFTTKGYITHMSLSDETADPAESETTETGTNIGPRKAMTSSTVSGNKITNIAEWAEAEANYTIRRAYLFTAASGGYLFATAKFTTPFPKTSDFMYRVTWEETYEQP